MTKNIQPFTTSLLEHYHRVRQQSLKICAPLAAEDYVPQPINDVSPPKWHLGHTTWFFENFVLAQHVPGFALFDERLNWFFNSYYESQGPRILRTSRGNMTRPDVAHILAYREKTDAAIEALLLAEGTNLSPELADLITLGLHHEQQHQELLLTDIKYILGTNPLFPPLLPKVTSSTVSTQPMQFLTIPKGLYDIGYQGDEFCWDNELSVHKHYLEAYRIADRLVTNGEYLTFMEDGGYDRFELWQMEGIEWARQLDTKAPLYWYEKEGEWYQYTLGGLHPLDLSLPVTHISWFEADAYARWAEARLPSEQEWEVACRSLGGEPDVAGNWLDNEQYHPQAASESDRQFLGHAWEWTNSAYLPYPRYPRPAGALGEYNGKFMINQMVLRGGSCATPHSHIRLTYRNFFHTDKRWQFTGIRLVRSGD